MMFKQQPTKDQITNRILYQTGRLDYLPIREPIDEIIVQQVERQRQLERERQEQIQRLQLEQEKQAIIDEIEKEVAKRVEEELSNLLSGFNKLG